jgi:hypothetical protein
MSMLDSLTQDIVTNNKRKEVAPLVKKWEKYGLLEGLKGEESKSNMAMLLQNQAKQLLKESQASANALGSAAYGDIQGYAAVAFPLVRRVFGSLLANDLVSTQPMSLPSGMIFFLDFVRNTQIGMDDSKVYVEGESIYGGDRVGANITKGILIDGRDSNGRDRVELGLMSTAHGYHKSRAIATATKTNFTSSVVSTVNLKSEDSIANSGSFIRFDPDLVSKLNDSTVANAKVAVVRIPLSQIGNGTISERIREQNVFALSVISGSGTVNGSVITGSESDAALLSTYSFTAAASTPYTVIRRLTRVVRNASDVRCLEFALYEETSNATITYPETSQQVALTFPIVDTLEAQSGNAVDPGTALGILTNKTNLEEAGPVSMPELRIKVNSMTIDTESRKLRASWTPELSQDLNAYHNIDAEVELTNLLSEQISQEIDQMLLNDLLKGATAGRFYWSRRPGKFVDRLTGIGINTAAGVAAAPPDFTGNVSMWYETLIETINDLSAQIQRKTLRGGATFIVCGPEVANILEFTAGFRASATHSEEKGSIGAVNVGSISKKFDVMVTTYFPRNVILVGRKGSGFLESGYVYAPYVPLQMTPTVFDPDNFTPRKSVMTRFGRKMVRPDMYGLVIVSDLLG